MLNSNTDVILELGLISKQAREDFLKAIELNHHCMIIHVLEADRDVRRERVKRRNMEKGETYSMHVPDDIFEIASDMWESITENEFTGMEIRYVLTGS